MNGDGVRRTVIGVLGCGLTLLALALVWMFANAQARQNGWFCDLTNSDGTIVVLPGQLPFEEFEEQVTDQTGCLTVAAELTVSGTAPPDTVIGTGGESLMVRNRETIRVPVESAPREFWLACGDFTGARAGNAASRRDTSCDPNIETRCLQNDALERCPEIGSGGQRCLNSDGQVVLACGPEAETCLDSDGRFEPCPG